MKIGLPNLAFKFPGVPTVEGRLLNTIDQTISITNFVPLWLIFGRILSPLPHIRNFFLKKPI